MAVNQTISTFNGVARDRDFARNNLFRLMALNVAGLTLDENDIVYCKGAKLPSREIPHGTVSMMGMKFPYPKSSVIYEGNESYELEFYLDAKSELRRKFEEASRTLFNDLTSTGDWRFPSSSDMISLVALDRNYEPQEYIKLYGASFKKIESIDFKSAEGDGEALTVKCILTYFYYTRDGSDVVAVGL